VLPAEGQPNEDGEVRKISVRVHGPLADAPVGRCVRDAVTAVTTAITVPEGTSGAQVNPALRLP
jgi:hypothetical protein